MPTIVLCPGCNRPLIKVRTVDGTFFCKYCRTESAVRIEPIRRVPKKAKDPRRSQGSWLSVQGRTT